MLLEDSKIRDKSYKNPNQILQISHTNYMELLFWVVVYYHVEIWAPQISPQNRAKLSSTTSVCFLSQTWRNDFWMFLVHVSGTHFGSR